MTPEARQRTAAIARVAVLLVMVALIVASVYVARQSARAVRERDLAREEAEFLVTLFAISGSNAPERGEIRAREILDRGAARIDREFANQPEKQAAMLDALGRAYRNLGLAAEAEAPLMRAVELRSAAHAGDDAALAHSLHHLARVEHDLGNTERAEGLYREALAMRERVHGERSLEVAESCNDLGTLLAATGKLEEAESLLGRSLEVRKSFMGRVDEDAAATLRSMGELLENQMRFDEAEDVYREALTATESALGADHWRSHEIRRSLGSNLLKQGQLKDSEPHLVAAYEGLRREFGDADRRTKAAVTELVDLYEKMNRPEDAGRFRALL